MVQQSITWSQSPLGKPGGGTSAGISSVYPGSCAHGSATMATRCSPQFYYLPPTPPTAAAPEPDSNKYMAVLLNGKKMQTIWPDLTAKSKSKGRIGPGVYSNNLVIRTELETSTQAFHRSEKSDLNVILKREKFWTVFLSELCISCVYRPVML